MGEFTPNAGHMREICALRCIRGVRIEHTRISVGGGFGTEAGRGKIKVSCRKWSSRWRKLVPEGDIYGNIGGVLSYTCAG